MRTVAIACIVCSVFYASASAQGTPKPLELQLVPSDTAEQYGAASLDGSVPAYWIKKSTNASLANTWVLFFQGGGWCWDDIYCAARANSTIGSSKNLSSTVISYYGTESAFPEHNSLGGANLVRLAYTDGASFSGYRSDPVVVNGQKVYYRGFANLQAILHDLEARYGLLNAKQVLVSGGSAGGLAAYLHAPYIAGRYGKRAQVGAAPCSGFFLDHPNAAGSSIYEELIHNVVKIYNVSEALIPACVSAQKPGEEWRCFFAANAYQHSQVPTFIINSPWDSWQLKCELTSKITPMSWDPRAMSCNALDGWEECGANFTQCTPGQMPVYNSYAYSMVTRLQGISKFSEPGNGAFLHSCQIHMASLGHDWIQASIGGKVFRFAFEDWWFGNFGGGSGASASGLQPAKEHTYLPSCQLETQPPHWCNPTCTKTL